MLFISYSTLLIKNENRAKNKLVKEFQTFRESYSLDHFQEESLIPCFPIKCHSLCHLEHW